MLYLQTKAETKFQEESKMKRNIFSVALLAASLLTLLGTASAQKRIANGATRAARGSSRGPGRHERHPL